MFFKLIICLNALLTQGLHQSIVPSVFQNAQETNITAHSRSISYYGTLHISECLWRVHKEQTSQDQIRKEIFSIHYFDFLIKHVVMGCSRHTGVEGVKVAR